MKNLTLRSQLFVAFSIMIMLTVVTGVIGLLAIRHVALSAAHVSEAVTTRVEVSEQLGQSSSVIESLLEPGGEVFQQVSQEGLAREFEQIAHNISRLQIDGEIPTGHDHVGREAAFYEHVAEVERQALKLQSELSAASDAINRRSDLESDAELSAASNGLMVTLSALLEQATIAQHWQTTSVVEELRGSLINARLLLEDYAPDVSYQDALVELENVMKAQHAALKSVHGTFLSTLPLLKDFARYEQEARRRLDQFAQQQSQEDIINRNARDAYKALASGVNELVDQVHSEMAADKRDLAEKITQANGFLMAVILMGVVLGISFALMILRMVTRPLTQCVEMAGRIANGDLQVTIGETNQTETGQLLNAMKSMSGNLQSIMFRVQSSTDELVAGNRSLKDANQKIASSAHEQAEGIESIAASLDGNLRRLKDSADQASLANAVALEANQQATEGNRRMVVMLSAMEEINGSSGKISQIIDTINEIAFQTNLLALNAAVEAARAGEHGRGFAVVASEVRSLALKSSEAANGTRELLEASVNQARHGREMAKLTADSLSAIVDSTQKVSTYIESISTSSREQVDAVEEINRLLAQVRSLTQQNAEISKDSALASDNLFGLTSDLEQTMAYFDGKGILVDDDQKHSIAVAR